MRLEIFFETEKSLVLPIQYNHLIQGMLYNNITPELASFLHDKGYGVDGRSFKLFTFSRLIGNFNLDTKNTNIIFEPQFKLIVNSAVYEFAEDLANSLLLKSNLWLGAQKLFVKNVNMDTLYINKNHIAVRTLSPVVAYSTLFKQDGGKYTLYLQPGDPEYSKLITENLRKKYRAVHGLYPITDEEVKVVRRNNGGKFLLIKYKDLVIKGYHGLLDIYGPQELLQIALDTGLGSKNAQGFGCLELLRYK